MNTKHYQDFIEKVSYFKQIEVPVFNNDDEIFFYYYKLNRDIKDDLVWSRNIPLSEDYIKFLSELNELNLLRRDVKIIFESI